jgi:hypothetical protein
VADITDVLAIAQCTGQPPTIKNDPALRIILYDDEITGKSSILTG